MDCPDYNIIRNNLIILTMHSDRDVPVKYVPKSHWLNPFRYELMLFHKRGGGYRININREGKANLKWSNLRWRLYGRKLWELKNGEKARF